MRQNNLSEEYIKNKRDLMLEQIDKDKPTKTSFFIKAYAKKSKSSAIKAKCLECCWLDEDAITNCSAPECPLWSFRPYSKDPNRAKGKIPTKLLEYIKNKNKNNANTI